MSSRGRGRKCHAGDSPPGFAMSQEAHDQQGAVGGQSKDPEGMAEISSLLRGLMQQQADRDSRAEQECRRQEDRWQRIQHQFDKLQQEVQQGREDRQQLMDKLAVAPGTPTPSREPASESSHSPATQTRPEADPLQPAIGGEVKDIEHYLITFERIALACQWPQEEWALHLAPLLTGKARSAYVAMDIDDTMDYEKVKCAVLQKFEICAETYRVRFRSSVPGEDETPKELQVRLKDLYDKWMTPKTKTKEQIGDIIIMEQFLKGLNPELRTWIKERNPKTSKEAAELAESFLAARRPPKEYLPAKPRPLTPPSKPVIGNEFRVRNIRPSPSLSNSAKFEPRNKALLVCHSCGQKGHFKSECPRTPVSKNYMCFSPQLTIREVERDIVLEGDRDELTIGVLIGDRPCVALLDSGSDRTLVRQDSLPRDVVFCGGTVDVFCIHGDKVAYPIAEVAIHVDGQQYTLSVGVLEHLPYQVVLGCDIPTLAELIAKQSGEARASCASASFLVVTRSKAGMNRPAQQWGGRCYHLQMRKCLVFSTAESLRRGKAGDRGDRRE